MASLELILTESEWQNLLSYREYAKQLYGVDISRKDECFGDSSLAVPATQPQQQNSNNSGRIMSPTNLSIAGDIVNNDNCIVRPSPVIVKIQCNSSFSNLEQCRKFAIACSPSNPDFKFTTITLESQPLSEMVKAYLPGIQKSTATFINSYPDSSAISIQGHRTCVDIAQHHIHQILQDLKTSETPSPNQNALNSIPYPNSPTNPTKEKSSNVDIDNHRHLLPDRLSPLPTNSMVSSPAKSDDSVFFSESTDHNDQYQDVYNMSDLSNLVTANNYSNVNYSTCPPFNASNAPPFQAYKEPCQNTVHRNGSSDEEGVEEILVDNRFSNRINQATKLGFSEKQVARVLKRLGVDSSMEDMMRELVSEPAEADQGDDDALQRDDGTEANLSGEDSDGSEEFDVNDVSNLRHVIIDGSNVAMSHGQKVFSCLGIKIVVDWFKSRGHKNITVFVPQWRKEASRPDAPITDQEILTELEAERTVVFTPSRRVGSTRIVCYDDRYVLQLAVQKDGIVVSNDVYRDLVRERDDFRNVVEKRLLMYSFVQDTFMPPEDPLGRQGPSLDDFLRIKPAVPKNKPQNCPYGKKCTYGTKCRYYHPERRYSSQKMVAEKLKENAELKLKSSKAGSKSAEAGSGQGRQSKQKLVRTVSMLPREDVNKMVSPADVPFQKPPLHHSKSLVYPSSYLTDLRLKMEQAESADVVVGAVSWSAGDGGNLDQTQTAMGAQEANSNRKSFSHPSPVTSPTPNLPPTFAVKSVKSSLNIPAPEPQDRYLSGHLLVAKKLSDEDNNSGNFFSQHTSRAPGSSQQQKRQDMPPCDGRLLSSDSNISPVSPTRPISTAHQSDESGDSNPWGVGQIYLPPEITTDTDLDQVGRTDSKLVSPTNSFLPQTREGRVSSSSPHSQNVQSSDQCDSCPAFSRHNDVCPQPHHHFRRSLSTSTPMQSGQCFKPANNAHRKFSLNMGSTAPMEHVHAKVNPHSSVPLNQIPFNQNYASTPHTNTPHFQPPFQRTSFDSGISSGGLSGEQLNTTTNSPFSPTDNFISSFQHANNTPAVYSPTNQNPARFTRHHHHQQQQQQQHHHHQQQQQHHHQQQQQQQADAAYLSSPSGFPSPSSPWQFSPLPNRMTMQPSFLDQHGNTTTPNMAATPFQPHHHHPQSHPHQQPTVYPSQHFNNMAQPPPTNPSMYAGHPVYTSGMTNPPSPYYPPPMQQGGVAGSPMPYNPPTMSPVSPYPQHTAAGPPPFPFQQQPQQSNVQDEEAAISVHDPRYDLYYHMSSMFGERVVRTFMNRNPDVRNVKELYSLLSSYKQDTGM